MAQAIRTFLLLTILITAFSLPLALAEWSHDPLVHDSVCDYVSDKSEPQIVSDGAGGMVVVWRDDRDANMHIYAQRVDRDGQLLWDPDGVRVCTYDSYQTRPRVVADGLDGYLIVWHDREALGATYNLFAQRLTNAGINTWSSTGQPISSSSFSEVDPGIATDGAGNLLIVWEDNRNTVPDIYAQKLNPSGSRLWGSSGVAICEADGFQTAAQVVSDDDGGAIFAWGDFRSEGKIYAQRVDSMGTVLWAADGVMISENYDESEDYRPILISDESGGAFVAWERFYSPTLSFGLRRVYANGLIDFMILPAGTNHNAEDYCLYSEGGGKFFVGWTDFTDEAGTIRVQCYSTGPGSGLWTAGGVIATPAVALEAGQARPSLTGDGHGGLTVCWEDSRNSYFGSIFSQRFNTYGQRLWGDDGALVALGTVTYAYAAPVIVHNTDGDFFIVWHHSDIYAKFIDDTGFLGHPAPAITEVTDFPNDQGGQVIVGWSACYLDSYDWLAVNSYSVWARESEAMLRRPRADQANQMIECSGLDGRVLDAVAERLGLTPERINELYRDGWIYVGEVPAMMQPEYSCVAFTFGDSTAAEIPWADYMVVAHGDEPLLFWPSDPASGYSVDNLTPGIPLDLIGAPAGGLEVDLSWLASGYLDEDLAFYGVYRGEVSGFPLDETHRIGETIDLTYLDTSGVGLWFYRVTAVDLHGNESSGSNEIEVDMTTSAVDDMPVMPATTLLHSVLPNPVRESAMIRFDLAEASSVDLAVYSIQGRRVATLASGDYPAGSHVVDWRGLDDGGRPLSQGVYFTQLQSGAYSGQKRLLLMR